MNGYDFPEVRMMEGMSEQQRMIFLAQTSATRKDEVVGVLLAVFLGHFGAHRFYLGENGWGVLYLLLAWTPIPFVLGLIEAFFMPGRVRDYNLAQAAVAAQRIRAMGQYPGAPASAQPGTGMVVV